MYIPNLYREDDTDTLIAFMRRHDFALVVSVLDGEPLASHLPLAVSRRGDEVVLRGHFARANLQWRALETGETMAVFQGPHAYVSPAHYDRRESVPTWNYLAVHATGRARLLDDETELEAMMAELIAWHEPAYQAQWDELPERYRDGMRRGVVGFELSVDRLEGKAKLSQNKTRDEQARIAAALMASDDAVTRATGAEMQRRLDDG